MEFLCFLLLIALAVILVLAVKGNFGRSRPLCPVCDEELDLDAIASHNLLHAQATPDKDGFLWHCPKCDEVDGVWPGIGGAAAGLTDHMRRRHQIYGR